MTMDDYADLQAYWAANPPVQRLIASYFNITPKPVRRRIAQGSADQGPRGASVREHFPDGILR